MTLLRDRLRLARHALRRGLGALSRLSARKAVVLLAALFLLLLAASDGVLLSLQYDRRLEEASEEAANLTVVLEQYVRQSVQHLDALLRNMAHAAQARPDAAAANSPYRFVFRRTVLAADLRIYGRDGRLEFSTLATAPELKDWSHHETFLHHRDHPDEAPFAGAPFKENGVLRFPLSRSISGRDGGFAGVAVVLVDLDTFATFFRSINVGRRGIVTIIRRDGQIIARYPALDEPRSVAGSPIFRQQVAPLAQGMVRGVFRSDGVERIGHFRSVEGMPLVVAVSTDQADALASWWSLVQLHAGILTAVALAVALLGVLIARQQAHLARTAAAMREEQRRLEAITAHLPAALMQRVRSPDGAVRFSYLSSGGDAVLGMPRDEFLADPHALIRRILPQDRNAVQTALDRSARDLSDVSEEFRVAGPDGAVRWLRTSARPRRLDDGTVVWDGLTMDVTAHKAAMTAKRVLERRLEAITGNVPGVVFQRVLDPEGRIHYTFVSPQIDALFGVTAAEVVADYRAMSARAVPEDRDDVEKSFNRQDGEHVEWVKEFRVVGADGQVRWVRGTATRHRAETGDIVWDGILLDVTMQKAAVAATRALQRRLEAVVANTPGVVFECMQGPEGLRFSFLSPQVEQMFGLPIRAALHDFHRIKTDIAPEDRARLDLPRLQPDTDQADWEAEFRVQPKEEAMRWIRGTARARRTDETTVVWNGTFQDVTQAKLSEEHTQRAQRNEALAHLTAGVAHEFNNLLTVIQGNLELLEAGAGEAPELIAGSQRAAERGARVTRALQAYARRQFLRPRTGRLGEMLQEVVVLLHSILGQGIRLELDIPPDSWPVYVDWDQLGDALIALAVKGKEAMPGGGVLRVHAANETLQETRSNVPKGDYVRLTVSDSGEAMAENARRHAFDPFYSATALGGGADLGLSAVFGFVRQSHGHVFLESLEGRGTAVSILLPRAGAADDPSKERTASA